MLPHVSSNLLMPPKHRKANANLKERRHESGLARPGRQIKKQKSDVQLNGSAHVSSPTSEEQIAQRPLVASPSSPPPTHGEKYGHDNFEEEPDANYLKKSATASYQPIHLAPPADGAMSGETSCENHDSAAQADHARLDPSDKSDDNSIDTTVIRSCSVRDVVAILLLLLQLPPTVLTVVNSSFAFLTFGSASAGWSVSSVASSPDWLQSYGGNPSIVTTIITDLSFLVVWLLLPLGKDLALDLAEAVVAISLAGGASGRSGRAHSAVCLWIIAINHLLRHQTSRQYGANMIWSLISRVEVLEPFDLETVLPPLKVAPFKPRSWPRILIELHIVCQGLVRMIRRSYFLSTTPSSGSRKPEPESPTVNSSSHTSAGHAVGAEGGRNTSTDGRQPGPSPAGRESKDKSTSSSKKRRKQATFVRSQQPFWAAIASTKVTVSREVEQSQSSRDSLEGDLLDTLLSGTVLDNKARDQVWITGIRDTEIRFRKTSAKPEVASGQGSDDSQPPGEQMDEDGGSGNIHVRVNGAIWGSTLFYQLGEEDEDQMAGKIFGLTPSTNYMIEFVRLSDGARLYTANLLTQMVPNLVEGIESSGLMWQTIR